MQAPHWHPRLQIRVSQGHQGPSKTSSGVWRPQVSLARGSIAPVPAPVVTRSPPCASVPKLPSSQGDTSRSGGGASPNLPSTWLTASAEGRACFRNRPHSQVPEAGTSACLSGTRSQPRPCLSSRPPRLARGLRYRPSSRWGPVPALTPRDRKHGPSQLRPPFLHQLRSCRLAFPNSPLAPRRPLSYPVPPGTAQGASPCRAPVGDWQRGRVSHHRPQPLAPPPPPRRKGRTPGAPKSEPVFVGHSAAARPQSGYRNPEALAAAPKPGRYLMGL